VKHPTELIRELVQDANLLATGELFASLESHMRIAEFDTSKLAKTGQDYLGLLKSKADWIVRNEEDIRALRKSEFGPLLKLPEKDFEAFVSGLEYKNGGVADGSYKPLMAYLTITEIFQVFERFGMDRGYTLRILEAKCDGGSCAFEFWSFCSSACASAMEPR
jgi:hypothetical protein